MSELLKIIDEHADAIAEANTIWNDDNKLKLHEVADELAALKIKKLMLAQLRLPRSMSDAEVIHAIPYQTILMKRIEDL